MHEAVGTQQSPKPKTETPRPLVDFGQVVVRATANGHDLESLAAPLLEALAKMANLDATYLTVFDWQRRVQTVRVAHCPGDVTIEEDHTISLPPEVFPETMSGVTRSPGEIPSTYPDSQFAKQLGLKTYVSVPVIVTKHQLFGMLCGASRAPRELSESTVSVMEFFAKIIADFVIREQSAAAERRAEVAEERLRTRAQFLAEAEHQLKTPLTAFKGAAEILRGRWDDISDDERNELLDMIVRRSEELATQIDELLVEARADVRARDLAPIALEIAPLARAMAKAFGGVSPARKIRVEVPDDVRAWVDPAATYQVLGHLLDNALKYSPSEGTIHISGATAGAEVEIEVADEGLGLPEGIDIFAPFRRGPASTNVPGIGLGLHIVRSLVEAMGGSVAARDNPGGGSTFRIRLPAAP